MRRLPAGSMAIIVVSLLALGCASNHQERFSTADQAVDSLVAAVRTNDEAQLKRVLGSDCDALMSSGDPVEDRTETSKFLSCYDEKHSLVPGDDGSMILVVGKNDWPFPLPIVKNKSGWAFDTSSGKEEIINRRIGQNELVTIQVCLAIVDAQREYARRDPDGDGLPEYAAKFVSDPGTKDGLFWKTKEGEEQSPLGPLVARAAEEGYTSARNAAGEPVPYHGYFFRILKSQGSAAQGGTMDYIVDGKMLGGFAVVAWPAQYGGSGVMTFMVSNSGVVYQRDLGRDTDKPARSMTSFDPGSGWNEVERSPE